MNTFSFGNSHKPLDSLMAWTDASLNGIIQLTGGGVTWCLDFFDGRLRYCNHSLQTFSAVEMHLHALSYEDAIEPSRHIFYQQERDRDNRPQTGTQGPLSATDSLAWTHRLVQQLAIQGTLSWEQANVVMTQLTKDSLEPALWLMSGVITPLDSPTTLYGTYDTRWQGSRFDVLMPILLKRFHVWQELAPYIQSPHQCPMFTDEQRIYEKVPGGLIPTSMLLALKHIMGDTSLRRLSQVLRQDELKLAQLLYPYVKQGIVALDHVEPALRGLPLIQPTNTPVNQVTNGTPKASNQQVSTSRFARTQEKKQERKQYKIVCIDDSPTMLETLKCYLGDDCFEVTTLENPMQSASTMFSSRPDLVLMDVAMPGIKGDRLCKLLRQSSAFKTTPIIMVTGLTQDVDKAGAIAMGANDYLAKPFSQEALLELVDQYLHFSR